MQLQFIDFLDRLCAAPTLEGAWMETVAYMRSIGIESVHYVYAPSAARPSTAWPRLTTWSDSWLRHYDESGFGRIDSSVAHCRSSIEPILSGPDFAKRRAGILHQQWLDDTRGMGINSEIVFPLRSLPGSRFGGLSAGTRFTRAEARRWVAEMMPDLRIAAQCADTRLLELARQREAISVGLSPREREVLLWLAAGLRNDRIAERMGIRNPTVELHLANARKKLQAATREQALARAILFGLISP